MQVPAVGIGICLALIVAGLLPLRASRRRTSLARSLETTPVKPLSELKPGPTATTGIIEADGDVHVMSGVTGRKCVYWEVIVDENNGGDIERLASQRTGVNVKLRSGNDACDIDFTGAQVTHDDPFEEVSDEHTDAEGLRSFLKRRMGFLNRPRSLKQLRYRETVLTVGHRVTVYGTARETSAGGLGFSGSSEPLFICLGSTTSAVAELKRHARLYRSAAMTVWAIASTGIAAFLWELRP